MIPQFSGKLLGLRRISRMNSRSIHLIQYHNLRTEQSNGIGNRRNIDLLGNVILAMLNIKGHDPHGSFPPYPVFLRETAGSFFTAKIQRSLTKEAAAMLCPTLLAISSGSSTFTDSWG